MKSKIILFVIGFVLIGCSDDVPTLLDSYESSYGIRDNGLGSDHRYFHQALHFPYGTGLHFPGYIVGIEKAPQGLVDGPAEDPNLLEPVDPNSDRIADYSRLIDEPKTHLITHVMRYQAALEENAVFRGRIRPCALYSLIRANGQSPIEDGYYNIDAPWHDDRMAQQLFPGCEGNPPASYRFTPFARSWDGIESLRESLSRDMTEEYSHIIVIVMGWNTPQYNAIQNFNSIVSHLVDEVETQRRGENPEAAATGFRPLVVGVTWASDWEISDNVPVPDNWVRGISFRNKANDAKEIGLTWLDSIIFNAILPAREEANSKPRVIVIGHSFGARASLTALTQRPALRSHSGRRIETFMGGDLFVSLQGAFKIEEIFADEDLQGQISDSFDVGGLRMVLTATQYDSAVSRAFWADYAGSPEAMARVCSEETSIDHVACRRLGPPSTAESENYGFGLCIDGQPEIPEWVAVRNEISIEDWKDRLESPVLYVDATYLANCRAAFTGGGSHSDIYRRETARFLWDVIN